jgi:outer membrane immunogenic protein
MRTLLFAAAAGLALTASAARAADLYAPGPAIAPAPVPPVIAAPPAPSWTGFYLGFNAGLAADLFEMPWTYVPPVAGASPLSINRGIAGIQGGYNWQVTPRWLVGLEAEFDGSDIQRVHDFYTFTPYGGPTFSVGSNLNWFGTVRPRIGFAVTPTAIFYLTGGWAYGHTDSNVILPPSGAVVASATDKFGWAGGLGLEYALTDWLSFKTEYIYISLGNDSMPAGAGLTMSNSVIEHTVKAGLNFKLGPWILH